MPSAVSQQNAKINLLIWAIFTATKSQTWIYYTNIYRRMLLFNYCLVFDLLLFPFCFCFFLIFVVHSFRLHIKIARAKVAVSVTELHCSNYAAEIKRRSMKKRIKAKEKTEEEKQKARKQKNKKIIIKITKKKNDRWKNAFTLQ